MHPHSDFRNRSEPSNFLEFLTTLRTIEPGVNTMQSDFAASSHQFLNGIHDIPGLISGSATLLRSLVDSFSRFIFGSNYKKRRGKTSFKVQIAIIKLAPEVLRKSHVYKG